MWPLEKAFHKEDLSVKRLLCGQIWLRLSLKVYKESGSFYSNCPKLCFNFHTRIWNLVLFLVFAIAVQTKQQVKTFFSQIIWKPHITKVQCYFRPSKYRQVDLRPPLVFWLCFSLNFLGEKMKIIILKMRLNLGNLTSNIPAYNCFKVWEEQSVKHNIRYHVLLNCFYF